MRQLTDSSRSVLNLWYTHESTSSGSFSDSFPHHTMDQTRVVLWHGVKEFCSVLKAGCIGRLPSPHGKSLLAIRVCPLWYHFLFHMCLQFSNHRRMHGCWTCWARQNSIRRRSMTHHLLLDVVKWWLWKWRTNRCSNVVVEGMVLLHIVPCGHEFIPYRA